MFWSRNAISPNLSRSKTGIIGPEKQWPHGPCPKSNLNPNRTTNLLLPVGVVWLRNNVIHHTFYPFKTYVV
jgi:hypothetical protein